MQITREFIEGLLWESESNTLDFKRDQYLIAGATNEQKGELIKDILAFANAFRRDDAYILIGVKDGRGSRAEVVGVADHLEDAHLQQLVSGRINQSLVFAYKTMEIEGKSVGVIHIPKQKRPFYLKSDFGGLKKDTVYFRRGSSTAVARPDEIFAMGADDVAAVAAEPVLDISLCDFATGDLIGSALELSSLVLKGPAKKDIPDYRERTDPFTISIGSTNYDYYRKQVEFTQLDLLLRSVSFAIKNSGDVTAQDVRVVFEINDPDRGLTIMDEYDRPERPVPRSSPLYIPEARAAFTSDFSISRRNHRWLIEWTVGKVQPKDTVRPGTELFIGSRITNVFPMTLRVFSDNLSHPAESTLTLNFTSEERAANLDEIQKIDANRFFASPRGKALLAKMNQEEDED